MNRAGSGCRNLGPCKPLEQVFLIGIYVIEINFPFFVCEKKTFKKNSQGKYIIIFFFFQNCGHMTTKAYSTICNLLTKKWKIRFYS